MSTDVLQCDTERNRPASSLPLWAAFAIIVVLGCAILTFFVRYRAERWSDLRAFWAPIVNARAPVAIYVEDGVAYRDGAPGVRDPARPSIPAAALIQLPGRYVHMGELECLVQLTSWLTRRSKPYRIIASSGADYSSLVDAPAVVLMRGDDPPSSLISRGFRFSIEKDAASGARVVHDGLGAANAAAQLSVASLGSNATDDYAVVTLVRRLNKAPVVVASSTTGSGSGAIGEFLTAPDSFARASYLLPRDWRTRNVQFVLRVPIVHGAAGHPEVVATHAW